MTTQKINKGNKNIEEITKIAIVKYKLGLAGYSQSNIAKMLNVSSAAVCQVISGKCTSKKISSWLKDNIGEF